MEVHKLDQFFRVEEGIGEAVLTGFIKADGNVMRRPVGVAIDKRGALLVADDVGNTIWCVMMTK